MKGAVAEGISGGKNAVDIRNRILTIRGVQVMIDRDLARLYQVEAKQFNRQVQRNIERFPPDFMFWLSKGEAQDLRCQIGTSSWGGDRYLPSAFTEQGIAMLSGILRSPKAIEVNIAIMRAFVAMRLVTRIVESAKKEIVVIDPYSDAMTLEVLAKKRPGVKVRLVCKDRGEPTSAEIAKFNRQYKNLTVTHSDSFHDRFILVDGAELHNLGSSINCLGRRVTSYSPRDKKEVKKLLALVLK